MKAGGVFLFAACLVLGGLASACAQSSDGTISGTVADPNDAIIPGATVRIKNTNTGLSRSTITASDGRYRFVNVPVGLYDVTAEASSFASFVRHGITLDSNQNAIVDLQLKPGTPQETITVTENASALNTTTAETGAHFDRNQLTQLPTAPDGSVYNNLLLAPGVTRAGASQAVTNLGVNPEVVPAERTLSSLNAPRLTIHQYSAQSQRSSDRRQPGRRHHDDS